MGMRNVLSMIPVLIFVSVCMAATAQVSELRVGLMGKIEFNRLRVENADNKAGTRFQPGFRSATGFYIAKTMGRMFFADASVLLSRAKYMVNYVHDGSTFMDADVRYTELNLSLNMILNPGSSNVKLFILGGGQLLVRRWGEERFANSVIGNTYWPATRLMAHAGLGAKCNIGSGFYLQPFAGLRYSPDQQLVYDVPINQYYFGAVLCYGIKGKARNRYGGCPTDF
jgi:hypothetical protein